VFAALEKRALQEAIVDVAECPVGDRLKDADGHEGEGADECGDCGSGCGKPIGASNLRLPANSKPDSADYTPDCCGNGGKLVAGRDDRDRCELPIECMGPGMRRPESRSTIGWDDSRIN
jgi:hypothetical protein